MQTIKLVVAGECERVFEVDGDISIVRKGDGDYAAECAKTGSEQESKPRAILQYCTRDSHGSTYHRSFIYDNDRAWIMNANGKTVATV